MLQVEIDEGSGFCFGVTTAIKKAEEELKKGKTLYCLGDIVHNGMECERLKQMGLITITHEDMKQLHDVKVLLRAHGEPPATYELARQNNIEIIDATCPVVLKLQNRIKQQYTQEIQPEQWFAKMRCKEPVEVRVQPERNAVERFLMEFASYEKRVERDSETGCITVKLWYDRQDETELLIQLLGFGPVLEILSPTDFRAKAAERIRRQCEIIN
jgi:hypothetical protein